MTEDGWQSIEPQSNLSDDEDKFLQGALLLGAIGSVLSIATRLGNLALFYQYFAALPQDRQYWMFLISFLGTPASFSSFMIAAGG